MQQQQPQIEERDARLISIIGDRGLNFDFNKIFSTANFKKEIFNDYNPKNKEILRLKDGITLPMESEEQKEIGFELMQCKKRFLDLMTNLIAKETSFVDANQDAIAKFQYVVNKIFQDNIKNYLISKRQKGILLLDTDIIFLYKGGTTMKIVYEKYKKLLQNSGFDQLFQQMASVFERSDSDYTVLINPTLNEAKNKISFELVYYEINILVYNCLDTLRNLFNQLPDTFIPFSSITENVLMKKILEMNDTLKDIKEKSPQCTNVAKVEKFIGITFLDKHVFIKEVPKRLGIVDKTFSSATDSLNASDKEFLQHGSLSSRKNDFMMSLTNNGAGAQYYREFKEKGKNNIYLSINEAHEYVRGNILTQFTLHRLKINSIAYYIAISGQYGYFSCPSELIDVTVLKKDAHGLKLFYEHVDEEYLTYTFDHPNFGFDFKSYSIYGHITDLIFVLFGESPLPWKDIKYLKRIKRMMFFVLLELVLNIKDRQELKKIFILIKGLTENNTVVPLAEKIAQTISIYDPKLASIKYFENLVGLMRTIASGNKTTPEDKVKYDEMFTEMNKIMKLIDLQDLELPTNIKEGENVTLLGGYYYKYLKYRAKIDSLVRKN